MILTTRPIDAWPGTLRTYAERPWGPFKASYSQTLSLLERELYKIDASHPVLQLAITERECRLDGQIRADARPSHPGVILAFGSRYGPLKYATDVYDSGHGHPGWQQNLRAIALGLEALRRVDRYGISRRGEQYTGWKALGAGIPMPAPRMTRDEAIGFLVEHTPGMTWDPDDLIQVGNAYRIASKGLHPDLGGDAALFRRAGEARDVLEAEA